MYVIACSAFVDTIRSDASYDQDCGASQFVDQHVLPPVEARCGQRNAVLGVVRYAILFQCGDGARKGWWKSIVLNLVRFKEALEPIQSERGPQATRVKVAEYIVSATVRKYQSDQQDANPDRDSPTN